MGRGVRPGLPAYTLSAGMDLRRRPLWVGVLPIVHIREIDMIPEHLYSLAKCGLSARRLRRRDSPEHAPCGATRVGGRVYGRRSTSGVILPYDALLSSLGFGRVYL